jgi:hypothetical protein
MKGPGSYQPLPFSWLVSLPPQPSTSHWSIARLQSQAGEGESMVPPSARERGLGDRHSGYLLSVAGQNPPGSSVSTTRGAEKPTLPPMEPRDL